MQNVAEILIENKHRDIALEINKTIKVIGNYENKTELVNKILKKRNLKLNYDERKIVRIETTSQNNNPEKNKESESNNQAYKGGAVEYLFICGIFIFIMGIVIGLIIFFDQPNSAQFETQKYSNGDIYVGELKDNKNHWQGTYTWANGDKYVGEWKDNKRHGQGTYTFAGGEKYVGQYKDGKRNGQGTYTMASGDKYVGEWKDSKKHGQGTYTWASGSKYVGEWKDDKHHGRGTYTWADGRKYVGEWKDDEYHGQGTIIAANGTILTSGIFQDGAYLGTKKSNQQKSTKEEDSLSEYELRLKRELDKINALANK